MALSILKYLCIEKQINKPSVCVLLTGLFSFLFLRTDSFSWAANESDFSHKQTLLPRKHVPHTTTTESQALDHSWTLVTADHQLGVSRPDCQRLKRVVRGQEHKTSRESNLIPRRGLRAAQSLATPRHQSLSGNMINYANIFSILLKPPNPKVQH